MTGASRGIGAATARLLATAGACVVALARDGSEAEAVAEAIVSAGGQAMGLAHDVTREADWEAAMAETLACFGRLHILVNNAGVFLRKGLEEQTLEDWRAIQSPNVEGVFLGMKHAFGATKAGRARPSGTIVNMSAIGGLVGTPLASRRGRAPTARHPAGRRAEARGCVARRFRCSASPSLS